MATAVLGNAVIDAGLDVLNTAATTIVICSAEPTTYNEANTTFKLGQKVFGAGAVFGDPAASTSPPGRKVSSAAVTDGTVSVSGAATHFAVIDGSRLLLRGQLASVQDVVSPQSFSLSSFDVIIDTLTVS